MIKYPGGTIVEAPIAKRTITKGGSANRGMSLEHDINLANTYYNETGRALLTKRPTPINIVKVDYTAGARIVDAYFEKQSTTDYNGVYRGKYLDFEAKSCQGRTSFPLGNIYEHQFRHLASVLAQGGLAFFIIRFDALGETYLVPAEAIITFKKSGVRRSLPLDFIKKEGRVIPIGYAPRLAFLDVVDALFF